MQVDLQTILQGFNSDLALIEFGYERTEQIGVNRSDFSYEVVFRLLGSTPIIRLNFLSVTDIGFENVRVVVRKNGTLRKIEPLMVSSTRKYEYFQTIPVPEATLDDSYTVELVAS